MSMSTHVMGFQPADEEWDKMKAAYEACTAADIEPPYAVMDFFDYEDPAESCGKEVDISQAVTEWSADMKDGFQVDLSKLPKTVKFIRFFNTH